MQINRIHGDDYVGACIVADEDGVLAGFACVQLKKSFCYDEYMPEITEVYVKTEYRKRGIAGAMINFAEDFCGKKYPLHRYELLTGKNNWSFPSQLNIDTASVRQIVC